MSETITYAELVNMLTYNPDTGVFTNKESRGPAAKAGTVAGTLAKDGYIVITLKGKKHKAHRLAWLHCMQEWPSKFLDHINGIKDDNRIDNLREATSVENQRNTGINSNNTSGYKGVSFDKHANKYRARITIDGKKKHLGLFTTTLEASQAYEAAAKQHFGDFRRD